MDSLKTAKVNAVPSASDFSRMYLADAFAKNVYFPGYVPLCDAGAETVPSDVS
jgi:hypothetical protein